MSGVLLRCPNCGTTRSTPGMCEACHEAEVRYYCTNHTPGLWLNASTCSQCGARLGETARPAAPPPPPRETPSRPPEPTAAPTPRPRFRAAGRPGVSAPPGRREPKPSAEEELSALREERGVPITNLQELLLAALQARRRPRPATEESRETPSRTRKPGGCFMRFVLLMLLLFLALAGGISLFGGSLLRLFFSY